MKILMLASEYPPARGFGLARFASELAEGLAQTGAVVHVVTCNVEPDHPKTGDNPIVHRLSESIPARHFHWVGDVVQQNLPLLDRADAIVREHGLFDLILSHDWLTAHTAHFLKTIHGLPWALYLHDTERGKRDGDLDVQQQYIHEMEAWAVEHADHLFTVSEFMRREIAKHFAVKPTRIQVVPPGLNLGRFEAPMVAADFRVLFAHPDERLLVFAGRLSPVKGIDLLVDAVVQLVRDQHPVKLIVAGDGVLRAQLEERAAQSDLAGHILFTGTRGDLALGALYRVADLVIVPSRYEPFGMVALEAAAFGTPVLVNTTGGLVESANAHPHAIHATDLTTASNIAREIAGNSCKQPAAVTWPTWAEVAQRILAQIGVPAR